MVLKSDNQFLIPGQWSCSIAVEEQIPEYGFIALLNNTMGFIRDVRLPRHALPEVYNLTLIPFIEEVSLKVLLEVKNVGIYLYLVLFL